MSVIFKQKDACIYYLSEGTDVVRLLSLIEVEDLRQNQVPVVEVDKAYVEKLLHTMHMKYFYDPYAIKRNAHRIKALALKGELK